MQQELNDHLSEKHERSAVGSHAFLREQADGLDKHDRLILTDREMDDERTDDTRANLQPQTRQSIRRLAAFKRIDLEAFDNPPKSRGDRLFSASSGGLSLELPEGIGDGRRTIDAVTPTTIVRVGHCYFLLFPFGVSSR